MDRDVRFDRWLASLEAKYFADLTFAEVTRALRALSSAYVERRHTLAAGAAFSGAGKRAAFALFYAPLHFLLVDAIARQLPHPPRPLATIVDLGCGTGAAGAAWAAAGQAEGPRVIGVDRNAWALAEAAATYRAFGIDARVRRTDAADFVESRPRPNPVGWLAAFTINELPDAARSALLSRLLARARAGDSVLIVEPIGRSIGRWWSDWRTQVEQAGGRADEWRFTVERPSIVARLDRAAGLDHREITGRSLWIDRL